MARELELLKQQVNASSQGKVATELGISKTSVNLLLKDKYPNPSKMYQKIDERFGNRQEVIGISVGSVQELEDIAKILQEIE
jgi:predicted transcriptional regulator